MQSEVLVWGWLCLYITKCNTWNMKMAMIPREAQTQNDLRAGNDEEAPIPNAMKFVTEVTVIADPAWAMAALTLSTTHLDFSFSDKTRCLDQRQILDDDNLEEFQPMLPESVLKHWTMTNISSIPMPRSRKGITVWAALQKNPKAEQRP